MLLDCPKLTGIAVGVYFKSVEITLAINHLLFVSPYEKRVYCQCVTSLLSLYRHHASSVLSVCWSSVARPNSLVPAYCHLESSVIPA